MHIAGVYGGAERTTVNLLSSINPALFNEITVAASQCVLERLPDTEGSRKLSIGNDRFHGWFGGVVSFISDVMRTYCLIRRESPDIVLSVMHYAATLSACACALPGIQATTVASLRGPAHEHLRRYERGPVRSRLIRFALRLMARLSDRIVVPSAGTGRELVQRFGTNETKVTVIPNSIDTEKVALQRQQVVEEAWLFSDSAQPVVCIASRLSREKNIAFLVRAFARVRKECACHLLILGSGPEHVSLQELANELRVGSSVTFLGYREDVLPYIDRSTVFLHSCVYEGFGYSIIEAMACGTPVIATDCPYGPREILGDNEFGVLCSMSDETELAAKLKRMLEDSDLRRQYAHAGVLRAAQYSVGKMAMAYQQVFEELSAESA